MKYKLDMSLLNELASISIVEAELEKEKKLLNDKIDLLSPKPVSAVDYSKEKVQGGITHTTEEVLQGIVESRAEIFRLEKLLNIYNECLERKKSAINTILTERQRYIFNETFIKGRTCEAITNELDIDYRTIIRERAEVVKKINGIKSEIYRINSQILEENA